MSKVRSALYNEREKEKIDISQHAIRNLMTCDIAVCAIMMKSYEFK